jgi:hypothetical protein
MREAGFRYVFLGIENVLEEDLRFLTRCAEAIDDAHFTLGRPVVTSAGGGEADVRSWNVIRSL